MTAATRATWAERVRKWRSSGLAARAFAEREGLTAGTLYWWSSHLGREAVAPIGFVEVAMPVAIPAGRIEIIVRDSVRIEVAGAFDAEVLRRVVAALESR